MNFLIPCFKSFDPRNDLFTDSRNGISTMDSQRHSQGLHWIIWSIYIN